MLFLVWLIVCFSHSYEPFKYNNRFVSRTFLESLKLVLGLASFPFHCFCYDRFETYMNYTMFGPNQTRNNKCVN